MTDKKWWDTNHDRLDAHKWQVLKKLAKKLGKGRVLASLPRDDKVSCCPRENGFIV